MESSTTMTNVRRSVFSRWIGCCCAAPLGANQRTDVENHDDTSITKDRGAGNAADRRDLRTDALHHDFAAAHELVGDEAGRVLAGAHEHDGNRDVLLRQRRRLEADERGEILEAIFLAVVVEGGLVAAEMARHFRLRQAQHAFNRGQRQRVELFARAHDERVADRRA